MNKPIKIKIALKNLPHKCERTLLVPEDINMIQVHFLIQISFGWENCHMFEFVDKKRESNIRVGIPDDFDIDFGLSPKIDIAKASLKPVFIEQNQNKPFWYWYDFGDDWWHHISFLKITKKDLNNYDGKPFCSKAIGKCPPENIGGPWGYAEFLDIINNKKHSEYKNYREWYGLGKDMYDEMAIDIDEINEDLSHYFKSDFWDKNSLG